jgi:hypothetical protein
LIPAVEPRGSIIPVEISQQLEELPGLLTELIYLANGSMKRNCIQLASIVRVHLNDVLHSTFSKSDLSLEIAEGHSLIEQHKLLMQQFLDKRENANQQGALLIQKQQSMMEQFRRHQRERDAVQARVNAKAAELKRLKAACHFHREQIATLLAETRSVPVAQSIKKRESIMKIHSCETPDLSFLTRELKEALEQNQKYREELGDVGFALNQNTDEFRGLMAVLRADQDDEDDGLTNDLQEDIIDKAFQAFNEYKHCDWSKPEEYRITSIELMRHFERLVCLKKLKAERRRKLRNRILALKQSVVTYKSALMGLMGEDLLETPV